MGVVHQDEPGRAPVGIQAPSRYGRAALTREGLAAIGKLLIIYIFVAVFWALFDQTGSAWVLQADKMDRDFMGIAWMPSQIQAIIPIMIMN